MLAFTDQWSGFWYKKANNIQYYFHLKETNDSLIQENTRLRNQLLENFSHPDTSSESISIGDTAGTRHYLYMPAKVVNNSITSAINYITIYRGKLQGVEPNMGVIGTNGIVGIVRSVSDNYAVVMSMLHKDTRISAMLKSSGNTGTVRWDDATMDPQHGVLTDIPRTVQVHIGDSVITSGFSTIFPKGIFIGYIDRIRDPKVGNFHELRIKFGTNFSTLQYVYVIQNFGGKEMHDIESTVPHE